jgi:hypothetical protein
MPSLPSEATASHYCYLFLFVHASRRDDAHVGDEPLGDMWVNFGTGNADFSVDVIERERRNANFGLLRNRIVVRMSIL